MPASESAETVASQRSSAAAVEARALSRRFGAVEAVRGLDLRVGAGEVFGLLGPDGAGKSTFIRMLATVLEPDSGDASVFGESVVHAPRRVIPRIGYMSQRFSMYPDLSVAENLDFFGTLRGVGRADRRQRASALLESMGLAEFRDRQAQFLSGGMKQKLMLAATLMHEPDLLLLDEPTTGVDPVSRREFWRIIDGLRERGKTVLVATPYMDEAERCTRVAFMDEGSIRETGTPQQVKDRVPGTLYEVAAGNPRRALAALAELPGVTSAHLQGELVRLLSAPGGPDDAAVASLLKQQGFADATVRRANIDMEAAFAFLAETGEAAAGPDAAATSEAALRDERR